METLFGSVTEGLSKEIISEKKQHKKTEKCKEISCDKSRAFLAEATPSEAATSLVCSRNKSQCRAASIESGRKVKEVGKDKGTWALEAGQGAQI